MSKENEWEDNPDMQEFLEWADQPGPWDEEDDKIHTVGGLTNDKKNGFMSFVNKTKMSREDFIEGQYYIAKKDTWFIEGTECLYVEHLYDDVGIFEGKIKLEDTTTKSWWKEHNVGDIIDDREACFYEEFKPKQK